MDDITTNNMSITPPTTAIPIPAELAGKTAEEMYILLRAEHEKEMAEVKQAQTVIPPVQPVIPTYNTFTVPPPQIPPAYAQPVEPQTPEPDYLTSPQAYMDHQFQQRVAPLALNIAESMRSTNRELFKNKVGVDSWNRYGQGVEQFIDSFQPAVRMQSGAYDAAYNYMRGTQVDKIVEEEVAKRTAATAIQTPTDVNVQQTQTPPQRTSLFQPTVGVVTSPSPPSHFNTSAPSKSVLSPDQKRMAEVFGLKDDEYLELAKLNTDWISQAKGNV